MVLGRQLGDKLYFFGLQYPQRKAADDLQSLIYFVIVSVYFDYPLGIVDFGNNLLEMDVSITLLEKSINKLLKTLFWHEIFASV